MKHGRWQRMAAVALAICLSAGVATPANALSWSSSGSSSSWWNSWTDSWNNFWDGIFGGSEQEQGGTLTLVENETTVTEDTQLRADTYALEKANSNTNLKYFDVTLYNYDATTINDATHQVEVDKNQNLTQWNGIYFNGGSPGEESYTYSTDGTVSYEQKQDGDITWDTLANSNVTHKETRYFIKLNSDGQYYPVYVTRYGRNDFELYYLKDGAYVSIATGSYRRSCPVPANNAGVDTTKVWYTTYIALYQPSSGGTKTVGPLQYAVWNHWDKDIYNNKGEQGQYTYSGLVESKLDSNKNIQFTKPEGGIFDENAEVKKIYTNVEMPFVYNSNTKYYTFDASQNGVYFKEDGSQGSTTAKSNGRLYFNDNDNENETTQGVGDASFGDGSKTVWAPFDNTTDLTGHDSTVNMDYHFGMVATIPFTMTANGRMNPTDNSSEAITFSFSGDDDVWVFIDGQLVLDIGGIHNRLDGTINFADNTWSLSESNAVDVDVRDYNGKPISGKLFNEDDQTGTLGQTLSTFAAKESHELTIFYLERGQGSSNCKIQFNLPMKDTVSVTKQITQSVDEKTGTTYPLTSSEQAQVNAVDFGFTLYKNGNPVSNARYNVVNANGQVVDTRTTNAQGHFDLKNRQTARFVGEIADSGDQYYVVEDWNATSSGYIRPTYTYGGTAAGGFTVDGNSYASGSEIPPTNSDTQSATVTAKGSDEAEDSLNFVCTNLWKHVDVVTLNPGDDEIVIDYGLSVAIDVLHNDVVFNGEKSLEHINQQGKYGTAEIKDGKIVYTLNEQLTGVDILTYTVKAKGENSADTKTDTAKVYIIPATTMYYEENFTGLVTFSDGWTVEDNGTADTYQEPGVVGTVGDSPYGSDVAYLDDDGDSNGTSKYVSTERLASSPSFSYTFTGTGTTFFARTTNNTAYMKVVVTDGEGNIVYQLMRDTSYKTENDETILYNIPVFTYMADEYGTYTVTVTLARNVVPTMHYGTDFWLDGIRVYNPMNAGSGEYTRATDAYARDGEANMTSATLREKLLVDYTEDSEDGSIEWIGDGFVIFTDSDGAIVKAADYQSKGPKEEVYLNDGQSVTFSLANWNPNQHKIYLGIKAPMAGGTVTINGNELQISNTCDCYYDISDYVKMEGNAGTFEIKAITGVISVTNIKVTGDAEFTIVGGPDINA